MPRRPSATCAMSSTKTPSGDVYSACFDRGPSFALEGRNDTSDPSPCSNGWLNEP